MAVHPPRFSMAHARRRAALGVVAVLTSALAMTACTNDDKGDSPSASPTSPSSASSSPSAGPVTLHFAVYGDPVTIAAYRALARAYMRAKPDITIKLDVSPRATAQSRRLDQEFDAGDAPDLFLTDARRIPQLVAKERVQPVDGLLEERGIAFGDSYERLGLEAMAQDSALQCMPSDVSPEVIFFNKRLLTPGVLLSLPGQPDPAQHGWTWEQFVAVARRMSNQKVKGAYLAPSLTTLAPLMRSAGTDIVDDPKRPSTLTLDDSDSRDPLDQILNLARNHRLSLTRAELAKRDALSRFEDGKLGMMMGTRALVPELRHRKNLVFDVYPLPSLGRPTTIADVSGYCINHDSEHVSDAADFLAFAVGNRGSALVARSGAVVPANLIAQRSPAFMQVNKFPINADIFSRVLRRADTMPNPPAWPRVVARTQPLINRLFYAAFPDLETTLSRLDEISAGLLAEPTPSPSPDE
jgi:multiple sugar transport system substrate-binding protein